MDSYGSIKYSRTKVYQQYKRVVVEYFEYRNKRVLTYSLPIYVKTGHLYGRTEIDYEYVGRATSIAATPSLNHHEYKYDNYHRSNYHRIGGYCIYGGDGCQYWAAPHYQYAGIGMWTPKWNIMVTLMMYEPKYDFE